MILPNSLEKDPPPQVFATGSCTYWTANEWKKQSYSSRRFLEEKVHNYCSDFFLSRRFSSFETIRSFFRGRPNLRLLKGFRWGGTSCETLKSTLLEVFQYCETTNFPTKIVILPFSLPKFLDPKPRNGPPVRQKIDIPFAHIKNFRLLHSIPTIIPKLYRFPKEMYLGAKQFSSLQFIWPIR